MSTNKHTPGPWDWDEDPAKDFLEHDWKESAPWLVDVCGKGVITGQVVCENHSDARLIAAAPELLEALEMCVKSMKSCLPDFNPFDQAAYDKARAAIAKARGES